MALPAEHVRATADALDCKPHALGRPRIMPWVRLRALNAQIQPAWAGAEVTLTLSFVGRDEAVEGIPLADGQRLEIFGDFAAARELIGAARGRAPEALIGPQAQLLVSLPRPEGSDERWYRRKSKEYGFASAASLALGKLHLWQGRLLKAENDFRAVVSRAPLDASGWRYLSLTRLLAGNADGGREAIDRLIALGARDTHAHYLRALALYRGRRFEAASAELEGVVRASSDDPAVRYLAACALVQQWRIAEAMSHLDQIGARAGQGWRLMAQKCRLCAQGHQAYRERMARDWVFRWRQRWKLAAARLAAAIGIIWSTAHLVWRRYPWALAVVFAAAGLGYFLFGEKGLPGRARDELADAQGQAPNMPCWYVSLVRGGTKPFSSPRHIFDELERRLKMQP